MKNDENIKNTSRKTIIILKYVKCKCNEIDKSLKFIRKN